MFTPENTTGWTTEELAALNEELSHRLAAEEDQDQDHLDEVEKAFTDEVAHR